MDPVHYEPRKTALLFVDPLDTRELLATIQEGAKA